METTASSRARGRGRAMWRHSPHGSGSPAEDEARERRAKSPRGGDFTACGGRGSIMLGTVHTLDPRSGSLGYGGRSWMSPESSVHRRATSTTSRARTRAASYERIDGGPRTEMDEHSSEDGVIRSAGPSTKPAVEAARTSIRHHSGRSTLVMSSTAALASRITGVCRRSECSDTSSADVRLARSSSYLCAASCSVGRPSSTRATAVTNRNQRARVLRKAAARYQTGQCVASVVSVRRTARIGRSARFCS